MAKELNKKGITVFLLRYRVVRILTDDPWQEVITRMKDSAAFQQKTADVRTMATDDAIAAISYVRKHAADFKIDSGRVGCIGFSAGGSLAISLATNEKTEARPDFAAFIYSIFRPNEKYVITANTPPVFIACASDDMLAPPSNSIKLYNAWIEKKRPAELHIYLKGGHGLRGYPANTWIQRFTEWIETQIF